MTGTAGRLQPASILPSLAEESGLLVVRLRSIGDIVLLTPALALLKRWRADLKISVLVESRFSQLLEAGPDIDRIIVYPKPFSRKTNRRAGLGAFLGKISELRREKFQVAVNLHGGPTSALLTAASGARRRVGFAHYPNGFLYHVRVPDARRILGQEVVHTAEHQASAFFWLGLPKREVPPPRLFLREEWNAAARAKLQRAGVEPGAPYAVLHPPALFATKQWPPERYAEMGKMLESEKSLPVVYTCGPGESQVLGEVEQAAAHTDPRRPIRKLDGLQLSELMGVLAGAKLFVGNDSGPAHIAGAFGIPVVAVFGSSNSQIWKPWRAEAQVVQNSYPCNPCPGDRCYEFERPECILSVRAEQVWEAVEKALAGTATEPSIGKRGTI